MTYLLDNPYTATDTGGGDTDASEFAWQVVRPHLSTVVRGVLSVAGAPIGSRYAVTSGGEPVYPTLVLTDDLGQTLALGGTPGGYAGTGPAMAARILSEAGLLHHAVALDTVARITGPTPFMLHGPRIPGDVALLAAGGPPALEGRALSA